MLVYTLDAVLLLITLTTLLAVALLSVRERVRDLGVLRRSGWSRGSSRRASSAPTPRLR